MGLRQLPSRAALDPPRPAHQNTCREADSRPAHTVYYSIDCHGDDFQWNTIFMGACPPDIYIFFFTITIILMLILDLLMFGTFIATLNCGHVIVYSLSSRTDLPLN